MRSVTAVLCGVLMVLVIIGSSYGATFSITASAGTGGSISPSGTKTISAFSNQTFNLTPYSGYAISNVTVDGYSIGTKSTYTFMNVQANHTIRAYFWSCPC